MAVTIMTIMVLGSSITARADDSEYAQYGLVVGKLDVEFYKNAYPDVVALVGDDPYALFEHYVFYGLDEGRIPYAGAQPGGFVNGYTTVGIIPELAANATLAEQTDTATDDYVYDLSDWTPEQMALLAQKQAEFDASGLIRVGSTETQVAERLEFIRNNLYPEGTKVGTCNLGAGKIGIALYGDDMYWSAGYDKNGNMVLPNGFVRSETKMRASGEGNIRDVRIGDTIYTVGAGTGHVSVVLTHDDKGITVVESNFGGDEKMHWGDRISWNELENGGNTIYQQQNKWTKIRYRKY